MGCRRLIGPPLPRCIELPPRSSAGWAGPDYYDADHAGAETAYRKAIELGSADRTPCLLSELTNV